MNEPKLLWFKMIHRPLASPELELATGLVNTALEDILAARRGHFITKIDAELHEDYYFHPNLDLTGHGRVKIWRVIDSVICKFDKYEISLRPLSATERERKISREKMQITAFNRGRSFKQDQRGRGCGRGYNKGRFY